MALLFILTLDMVMKTDLEIVYRCLMSFIAIKAYKNETSPVFTLFDSPNYPFKFLRSFFLSLFTTKQTNKSPSKIPSSRLYGTLLRFFMEYSTDEDSGRPSGAEAIRGSWARLSHRLSRRLSRCLAPTSGRVRPFNCVKCPVPTGSTWCERRRESAI